MEDLFGLKSIQKSHVENHSRYQDENYSCELHDSSEKPADSESGFEESRLGKRKEISGNFPTSKTEKLTTTVLASEEGKLSFASFSSSSSSSSSLLTTPTEIQRAIAKTPSISFPLIPAYDEDEEHEDDMNDDPKKQKKSCPSSANQLFEKSIQNVLEKEKAKEKEKETHSNSNK